jgi:hypothetical protein
VFAFLLINRRQRSAGMPWLPRDPLEIVFRMVAASDFRDDALRISERKALLTRVLSSYDTDYLREIIEDLEDEVVEDDIDSAYVVWTPFEWFCHWRRIRGGVTRETAKRKVLIEFIVLHSLGLLDLSNE